MVNTRKISDAEWETHKESIKTLYQSKTLNEVISLMEQDYGFIAKKSQYTRKFTEWNLSKNSTSDRWKSVARKLEKRKREGKESEIYANGELIPKKKLQKAMSRYILPSYYNTLDTAPSPQTPAGIEVCTPRGEFGYRSVSYLCIPWFEFEEFAQRYVELPRAQFPRQSLAFGQHDDSIFPEFFGFSSMSSFNVELPFSEQQWNFLDIENHPPRGNLSEIPTAGHEQYLNLFVEVADQPQLPLASSTSKEEAQSIFAYIMGVTDILIGEDVSATITSRLDGFIPERQDGELVRNIKKIFELSSVAEASLQLLRYTLFLSSNDLLKNSQLDKLLEWMIKTDQAFLIERLIKVKLPTTEIFLSHLLVSATRLQETDMVLSILAHGVDVNMPAGETPKTTALYVAAAKQDVHLVRLLLNAGANPNASIGFSLNGSPLQVSVRYKSTHELIQMLLDAGGDVNIAPNYYSNSHTLLTSAALQSDATLVRIFLKAKAEVNMMTESSFTALQAAASVNDMETIQILVDAGADVNAPRGNRYNTACAAAANRNSFKHLVSPLQYAAYHNNIEMVQTLLELDADVDGYNPVEEGIYLLDVDKDWYDVTHLQTPLQLAVLNKNRILVRLLLSSGADTNAQRYGDTPLQIAARQDDAAIVRLLLKHGAQVNNSARGNGARTALQAAAYTGNVSLLQMLLDEGADINAPPAYENGMTAIQAAAQGGHTEILRILKALEADINAEASPIRGRTCLQAAAQNGNAEMIRLVLKFGAEVNAPAANEWGRTALQAAIESSDRNSVDLLLNSGADTNAEASATKGVTALYAAIRNVDCALVRRLLETADPNGNTSRHPPIVKAVKRESIELVKSLIEAGSDVNAFGWKLERSWSALQAAVEGGSIELVRILLKAGANPNALIFGESVTPLHLAIEENRSDIVRLLLANGASINPAPNIKYPETTALGEALSRHQTNQEIVEQLIAAGADVNRGSNECGQPLVAATKDFRLTKRLLDAGSDVNAQWPGQPTALQQACSSINIDTIELLLDAGANINAAANGERGRTALQAAVERGNTHIIKLLLDRGADCNALPAESYGGTALQLAAIRGRISVVLLLLRAGAEINAAPSQVGGRTALEGAAENGRLDIVSLLLQNDTDEDGIESRCQRAAKLATANDHPVIARILKQYKRKAE